MSDNSRQPKIPKLNYTRLEEVMKCINDNHHFSKGMEDGLNYAAEMFTLSAYKLLNMFDKYETE